MNRRVVALVLIAVASVGLALFVRDHYQPRRARPQGWRQPWDSMPLETESGWSLDAPRREVLMQAFYQATPELSHCNNEYYRGTDSTPTKLELLVDVTQGSAQLLYVVAEPNAGLPPRLLSCVERALESTRAVRHPQLAGQTVRWRLGLNFLVHPPVELPKEHWWDRFVPDAWRDYDGDSSIHVG